MYVYELVPGMVHELDMLNKRSVGTVICTAAHPIFPGKCTSMLSCLRRYCRARGSGKRLMR
jgi:hypothetical protein